MSLRLRVLSGVSDFQLHSHPVPWLLCSAMASNKFSVQQLYLLLSSFFVILVCITRMTSLWVYFSIIKIAQFAYVYTGRPFLLQVATIKYKIVLLGILHIFSLLPYNHVSNKLKKYLEALVRNKC